MYSDPVATLGETTAQINWRYLWAVGAAAGVTIVVVRADSHWALNFLHVLTGVLWTGTDLFMGFVIGTVLRRVDLHSRRAIVKQLSPRTLFLMPTLAGVTIVTGIELAERAGYFALAWPGYGWLLATLIVVTVLTIQGIGILTPLNLIVFLELRKAAPDMARVGCLMRPYLFIIASQGVMQLAIIAIMARFVTGI